MASMRQAARWTANEQDGDAIAMRWALQGVGLVVVLSLVAWAVWTMWNPRSFPLRSVRLTTPLVHVTPEEIRSVVAQYAQAGFVRIDMDELQKRLEAIPWVYRISLRRVWPDVIEVGVDEQVPVARWEKGGLVNEHGDVFSPGNDSEQPQLPLFAGPEGAGKALVETQQELSVMLAPIGLQLRRIELSERRAWSIEMDNGLQLALGRSETSPRLQRFVKTYTQIIAPHAADIERIDLRYTNGFAIRWRDGHAPSG